MSTYSNNEINDFNPQYYRRLILLVSLFFFGLFFLSFLSVTVAIKLYDIPCTIEKFYEYLKVHNTEANSINALIFAQVFSQIFSMGLPFFIVMQLTFKERMYEQTKLSVFPSFLQLGLLIILSFAVLYPQSLFEYINSMLFDTNIQRDEFIASMIQANNTKELIINIGFMAVLPALCEEMFFRGGIYFLLKRQTHKFLIPAVLSSLFFAMTHDQLSQILVIFLMGLLLAFIYEYTDSLWACIILHMINNLLFVLSDYYHWNFAYNTESFIDISVTIISLFTLVVIIYYLLKKQHQKSSSLTNDEL